MNGYLIPPPEDKQITQEFNVVLFSGDRDWLNNTQENRYNFTANFRIANNGINKPLNPVVQKSFKNVKILELTKVTVPAEGIDMLVRRKNNAATTNTDVLVSALTLPYLTVNVKEWVNNNYGTNNYIDRSFGILQYDANWMEDPISIDSNTMTLTRGYYGMLPKFLTCQKKFDPTPLATLTKLSFQLLRPTGELLSSWNDTFNISNITLQNLYGSNYYIVQTTQYFPRHILNIGDRIIIGGFSTPSNIPSSLTQFAAGFTNFINQQQGFIVADCGNLIIQISSNYSLLQMINITTTSNNPYRFGSYWTGSNWIITGNAATSAQTIQYSTDGYNWISCNSSGGFASGSTYAGGRAIATNGSNIWVAVGEGSNNILVSSNSYNFTSSGVINPFSDGGNGVAYGNGVFVAVGNDSNGGKNNIKYSLNGSNWLNASNTQNFSIIGNDVKFGNGYFCAVGQDLNIGNIILYSTNGSNWSNVNNGYKFTTNATTVLYNNPYWVIGTDVGQIYYTSDLTDTNSYNISFAKNINSFNSNLRDDELNISYFIGLYGSLQIDIIVGNVFFFGYYYDSLHNMYYPNYLTQTGSINSITYGNGVYVIAGIANSVDATLKYSSNLINWYNCSNIIFNNIAYSVNYNGSYFLATGDTSTGQVINMISSNGINWAGTTIVSAGTTIVSMNYNNNGYGNTFAIDAYNPTPATGTVPPVYFTNSTDTTNFFNFMSSNTLTGCRAINMSHQTTTYLKITTTSYDPGSLMRADNI